MANTPSPRPYLWVEETWIDRTRNIGTGESDVYESRYHDPGSLYRAMRSEYGRCVSKVYVDRSEAPPIPIGWVFQARRRYTDTREPYTLETWVTVHEKPPTRTVTPHYVPIDRRRLPWTAASATSLKQKETCP